jgi:hypothetical protein
MIRNIANYSNKLSCLRSGGKPVKRSASGCDPMSDGAASKRAGR